MDKITVVLIPEKNSFKSKIVFVLSKPIQIGRLTEGLEAQTATAIRFPSKVVSRSHALFVQYEKKV